MEENVENTPVVESPKSYETPELTDLGSIESMTLTPDTRGSIIPGHGTLSDRNAKKNFAAVDPRDVLATLAKLQVMSWTYKTEPDSVTHIGPMAQDFAKAFGTGDSDKVIHNADSAGVTMAAIQGLYQLVQEQGEKIAALEAEVRALADCAMPA